MAKRRTIPLFRGVAMVKMRESLLCHGIKLLRDNTKGGWRYCLRYPLGGIYLDLAIPSFKLGIVIGSIPRQWDRQGWVVYSVKTAQYEKMDWIIRSVQLAKEDWVKQTKNKSIPNLIEFGQKIFKRALSKTKRVKTTRAPITPIYVQRILPMTSEKDDLRKGEF